MEIFDSKFNFNLLSIKDLLEARDLFHVHLINKKNVIATAIGRYRIRKSDPWPTDVPQNSNVNSAKEPRTLKNSEVRDYSWPCILVFISQWENKNDLCNTASNDLLPKSIYMPDGRIVPLCIVEAPRSFESENLYFGPTIVFPNNFIGGGFPLFTQQQGTMRVASIGCVVTDGNKYFALTNRHVTGDEGTPIYTRMKGKFVKIGNSSRKEIGKTDFKSTYCGWEGKMVRLNNDVGLIEIEDINQWKTDIFGLGQLEEMVDLNTMNLSLSLITALQPDRKEKLPRVKAFGAFSGLIQGEIIGLFYRYKSKGGIEYVTDFLIGGPEDGVLNIHHGDSGTLWIIETSKGNQPFAVHWGQHNYIDNNKEQSYPMGLATNLTNVCVGLDIDVVRNWNLDNDYSWGKTGHFKIAAKACELVRNKKLKELLLENQKNIGYSDIDLIENNVISGSYSSAKNDFVPLSDVADIIWRWTRKNCDESNHYCDVDECNTTVFGGSSLLNLCLHDNDKIDINFWLEFYQKFDEIVPILNKEGKLKPRDGSLPFRVWQMYQEMVSSIKNNDLNRFICAGGTMSHYVADACNSLHISHLHHGRDSSEVNVHTDYENKVIDKNKNELFDLVNKSVTTIDTSHLVRGGKEAAKRILELMSFTVSQLPPEDICKVFVENLGQKNRIDNMWQALKEGTKVTIAEGCMVMALLWESAWVEGQGDAKFKDMEPSEIDKKDLKRLYNDKTFVPSYKLNSPKLKELLVDAN